MEMFDLVKLTLDMYIYREREIKGVFHLYFIIYLLPHIFEGGRPRTNT